MKKFLKSIAMAVFFVMTVSCTAFAKVNITPVVNERNVIISGTSDHAFQNVMIETWSGNKKYYIDAAKTGSNGDFRFNFNTEENLDYTGEVNVGGELKSFTFSTKSNKEPEHESRNETAQTDNDANTAAANNQSLNELKEKLGNIGITSKEYTVKKENGNDIIELDDKTISSKIAEVNDIIKQIESADKNAKFTDDTKVIPIKINEDSGSNTVLRLQNAAVEALNSNGFGLHILFNDSEIKIPKKIIKDISTGITFELVKNNVKSSILNKAESLLPAKNKLLTNAYNINLNMVDSNEETKTIGLSGTVISIKIDALNLKNVSKNTLKICIYDNASKKWSMENAKYDEKNGIVTAEIK